ncbi:hypothetical protein [Morganella psychrotolerans]|uniref:Uncharacterized protein n=1 Tax=Morganella psychrotolerans TaxID=368603 RepID=A0A1B8HT40_9GAMM|nr:hypothetical protein [Morganella psychrotolerans]OBU13038.1 hypothetical protein AYY18_14360 [Morganella psychrotolerans]
MEPTDFEKWCAGELGYEPEHVVMMRKSFQNVEYGYTVGWIEYRYRAYIAGVTSMLPYKTPAKGVSNELD